MGWEEIKDHPVWIGGHRKSGTTLLVSLLDHHPELFVYPGESAFFYKFYPIFDRPEYSFEEKEERIAGSVLADLDQVVRDWIGADICPDFSRDKAVQLFNERLRATPRETKDYFETAISVAWDLLPGRTGRERFWVEKTTSIEIYANVLFEWYPEAKFIHLLRDPRDNYASIKSGWEKEYRHYFDSQERLLQSVIDRGRLGMELAEINRRRYGPTRYLVLKYEDLVSSPAEVMRRISDFLGIEFQEILLKPTFGGRPWGGNSFENKVFDSVSNANLNRWKERINEQEAKVLEFYFRPLLEKYGYPLVYREEELADAAVNHYKWFNYAQTYSLKVDPPARKRVYQKMVRENQ